MQLLYRAEQVGCAVEITMAEGELLLLRRYRPIRCMFFAEHHPDLQKTTRRLITASNLLSLSGAVSPTPGASSIIIPLSGSEVTVSAPRCHGIAMTKIVQIIQTVMAFALTLTSHLGIVEVRGSEPDRASAAGIVLIMATYCPRNHDKEIAFYLYGLKSKPRSLNTMGTCLIKL
ncbi:hypothetical protein BDV19DRAFT_6838 [Aspergillus venezuelensis]